MCIVQGLVNHPPKPLWSPLGPGGSVCYSNSPLSSGGPLSPASLPPVGPGGPGSKSDPSPPGVPGGSITPAPPLVPFDPGGPEVPSII